MSGTREVGGASIPSSTEVLVHSLRMKIANEIRMNAARSGRELPPKIADAVRELSHLEELWLS